VPGDAIFCTISQGHAAGYFSQSGQSLRPGKPVSATYARELVKRLGRAAQIERPISPHTLRHTAITRYLRATGNLELPVNSRVTRTSAPPRRSTRIWFSRTWTMASSFSPAMRHLRPCPRRFAALGRTDRRARGAAFRA
jgi:hypothetical protein